MINLDVNNLPQELRVFLCKPDGSVICELNGMEPSGASLVVNLNNQNELSFDYYRYIDADGLVESNGYDSISIGMKLFVENFGYFRMKYPPYTYDGEKEYKHITAYSIDNELEDKDLVAFKINTGEVDVSLEYLVDLEHAPYYTPEEIAKLSPGILLEGAFADTPTVSELADYLEAEYGISMSQLNVDTEITFYMGNSIEGYSKWKYIANTSSMVLTGEQEDLLNPYTGIPYDYIVFYNTFVDQLTALQGEYSDGTYSANIPEEKLIIDNVSKYCKLIPRLVSKANKSGGVITSVTEFVKFTYNSAGEIASMTLDGFNDRVAQLIPFYAKYGEQLSLLDLVIENSGINWTIGEIDESLMNKRCQFDIDGQNVYSFLTQDIAKQSNCIAVFDCINYTINYKSIDSFGNDSGVIMGKENLINTLNINTVTDNIVTRYNVSGGNNLNIMDVNFGSNRIVNIDYFLNARDNKGNRIYMSDSLATKYINYKSDCELARKVYIGLVKEQNQLKKEIDEITLRVPNDEVKNDWGTFTVAELQAALTNYTNLLLTLKSMYREDFPNGVDGNDEIIEDNPPSGKISIKETFYWHDYYAYKEAITQIEAAILAIQNDTNYNDITSSSILVDGSGNSVNVAELIEAINAWKTEWTLYGTTELQSIIKSYNNKIQIFIDQKTVIIDTTNNQAKNWSSLTDAEKTEYSSESSYNTAKTQYNNMISERNAAQSYLESLKTEISTKQAQYDDIGSTLKSIRIYVALETYDRKKLRAYVSGIPNKSASFNISEVELITGLYVDRNYSNNNILTTSIDDIVSMIDIEAELLNDAQEQLSIESQPQFSFTTDIDNLLVIPEFQNYRFETGNYALVQYYNDYYIKLRLNTIKINPFMPEDSLAISFTNFTKSNAERSDISFILGESTGGSRSGGSGSSGGSGGFGTSDKIDVTISNTMLAKLLNTEMFASRVSDVVLDSLRVNYLNAKFATFGGLAGGSTTIDGSCIKTGVIKSNNYNGTTTDVTHGGQVIGQTYDTDSNGYYNNTTGSIIKLFDGTFNLGNKIKYNGTTLSVNGAITATSLSTGSKTSSSIGNNGIFIDSSGNLYAGSLNQTQIKADGTFSFGGGNLTYNGATLNVNGTITAGAGSRIGCWDISDSAISYHNDPLTFFPISMYFGIDGISLGSAFSVTPQGKLTVSDIEVGTSGIFNSSQSVFKIVNGRMYCDSPAANATWTWEYNGTTYTLSGTSRVSIDTGGIDLTGVYTSSAKFWDEIPDYWTHFDAFGLDFNRRDTNNQGFTTLFGVSTKTGGYSFSCSLPTYFGDNVLFNSYTEFGGSSTWFRNSVVFLTNGFHAYYSDTLSDFAISPIESTGATNGYGYIGSNSYRWKHIYCVALHEASDKKIKEHVEYLSNNGQVESFIRNLKPAIYTFKSGDSHRHHMGLYAQDVSDTAYSTIGDIGAYQAAVIDHDEDGRVIEKYYDPSVNDEDLSWVMNYSELIAPTIAVLQKALDRIDTLEEEIKELKGE